MSQKCWNKNCVESLYQLNLLALMTKARVVHKKNFKVDEIELDTLLSIKTGACPEDCGYCTQSGHYQTNVEKENLLPLEIIVEKATLAKENGAFRFCMGAAWRSLPPQKLPHMLEIIKKVKSLGLETCMTLGMLEDSQAQALKSAGLDFYNHNLDTSPEYYKKIITTRSYQHRLDTLHHVRNAGIKVCCGGIIGMGESREDRIELLLQLANLPKPPESVPINRLVPMKGTPLENVAPLDNFEFIRTVAIARIMMPTSMVRLTAGRDEMSEEMQTLCFMAGANSIHFGDKLLTCKNPEKDKDISMISRLGLKIKKRYA